mgnify:CR=1 FL=1
MLLFNNMGHWFWLNVVWLPIADMLVLPASVLGLFGTLLLSMFLAPFLIARAGKLGKRLSAKDFAQRAKMVQDVAARAMDVENHVIVCGFGRVGRNVAHELVHTRRQFVAIDMDEHQLLAQLEHFPELLYLTGDASDDDLLLAADIADAAGVFAVTGDDSRNLMITITARQLNPDIRIVARCHEIRNAAKMKKAGADAIFSPDLTGGMRLASLMVRPHVVSFLDEMLKSEKRLRVEEVAVPGHFPPTPLGNLKLRSNEYVLLAVREKLDWVFNPPKDYELKPGYVIVAMASALGRQELEASLLEMIG